MSRLAFEALLAHLDALVAAFETHSDTTVREQALELLHHVDAVHREGLSRLVERLGRDHPRWLAEAAADPVIRLFLTLYDLVPPERAVPGFIPLEHVRLSAALAQARREAPP